MQLCAFEWFTMAPVRESLVVKPIIEGNIFYQLNYMLIRRIPQAREFVNTFYN